MNKSLDPRICRLDVTKPIVPTENGNHWPTWEVFHQKKRGSQPSHVGIVHGPDAELAMVMAKEVFGRRDKTANLWIVKSEHVFTLDPDDSDMFDTATSEEKQYREPGGFSVRDKINAYKKRKEENV